MRSSIRCRDIMQSDSGDIMQSDSATRHFHSSWLSFPPCLLFFHFHLYSPVFYQSVEFDSLSPLSHLHLYLYLFSWHPPTDKVHSFTPSVLAEEVRCEDYGSRRETQEEDLSYQGLESVWPGLVWSNLISLLNLMIAASTVLYEMPYMRYNLIYFKSNDIVLSRAELSWSG